MKLTKDVRQNILKQNEGYKIEIKFDGKNYQQEDTYLIKNEKLIVITKARIINANKAIKRRRQANDDEVKKFIKKYLDQLKTEGG